MKFTRRNFLQYSFLTAAAAALSGCGRPVEHGLLSQYQMPEYLLPGQPVWFASACGPNAVAIKVVEGRAIKMEGMPGHPLTHGKLSAGIQAELTQLYHPERLLQPLKKGQQSTWQGVVKEISDSLAAMRQARGTSLFLVDRLAGFKGTMLLDVAQELGAQIAVVGFPNTEVERSVMKAVAGKAELPFYPLEQADYVVNFGSDFLNTSPLAIHYNWAYGEFRQGHGRQRGTMVSVSSHMNLTCANADRWLPVVPGTEGWIAAAVGNLIGATRSGWSSAMAAATPEKASQVTGVPRDLIERLAKRLAAARRPLVIAGPDGSYDAAGLHAMHSLGKLVSPGMQTYEPDNVHRGVSAGAVIPLSQAMQRLNAGNYQNVWVFDCNPAYVLPGGMKFAEAFAKAKTRVAFSQFKNETTALCDYVLPTRTFLEEWTDSLITGPFGSVYNVGQPVVQPRFDARSLADVLLTLVPRERYTSARAVLKALLGDERWDAAVVRGGLWKPSSHTGEAYHHPVLAPPPVVGLSGAAPEGQSPWQDLPAAQLGSWPEVPAAPGDRVAVIPYATVSHGDGSRANSPWMQELQDPMTTIVYSSWIEVNKQVAEARGIKRGDVIQIKVDGGGTLEGPAFPTPAVHASAVAIPIGQGRGGDYSRFTKAVMHPLNPLAASPASGLAWGTITKTGKVQFLTTTDRRIMGLEKATLPH